MAPPIIYSDEATLYWILSGFQFSSFQGNVMCSPLEGVLAEKKWKWQIVTNKCEKRLKIKSHVNGEDMDKHTDNCVSTLTE